MQVFIVRPFGTKQLVKNTAYPDAVPEVVFFDFDRVEKELILPALKSLQLDGGTTGRILESGTIGEDIISLLLLADIVIADISIDNANVFYELGKRHALKNKTTILIKCPGFEKSPFDIPGFRYVTYDNEEPGYAIPLLIKSIQKSQLSNKNDSPVFLASPNLDIQDTEKLFIVPGEFLDETEIAIRAREPGKLALLASEADSFVWKIPAQRKIGEALVNMEAYDYARNVWEKIKDKYPHDKQANINLAAINAALTLFPSKKISHMEKRHYLLFTGHMIDKPGRAIPRFPAAKETAVRAKIKEALERELIITGPNITGISGGSCGADIIFQEICQELGVPCKLLLAIPGEQFINTSVSFAGPSWVERFDNLYRQVPVFILANVTKLPGWLSKKQAYNIWERNNSWALHTALINGGPYMTLIALWDGKQGDAMGGTDHMVNEAILRGAKTIIIDINQI